MIAKAKQRETLVPDDGYNYHRKNAATLIDGAIKELTASIGAVEAGKSDPPRLRALLWGLRQYVDDALSKKYAFESEAPSLGGSISKYGNNLWKCNNFVADAYASGAGLGISTAKSRSGEGPAKGYPAASADEGRTKWGPQANELSNDRLRNLTPTRDLDVTGAGSDRAAIALPGDIIAFPAPGGGWATAV